MEHLPEFMENCQYGKQIDDFLDIQKCQKRPQARKPIFLGLEPEKSENQVPKFEECQNMEPVLLKILCRLEYTLLQMSSRGTDIMKN